MVPFSRCCFALSHSKSSLEWCLAPFTIFFGWINFLLHFFWYNQMPRTRGAHAECFFKQWAVFLYLSWEMSVFVCHTRALFSPPVSKEDPRSFLLLSPVCCCFCSWVLELCRHKMGPLLSFYLCMACLKLGPSKHPSPLSVVDWFICFVSWFVENKHGAGFLPRVHYNFHYHYSYYYQFVLNKSLAVVVVWW